MTDINREIGRHDAQIEGIEDRLAKIEGKLDTLVSAVDQAKGGWRILLAVYAFATAITAAIFKAWGIVKGEAG